MDGIGYPRSLSVDGSPVYLQVPVTHVVYVSGCKSYNQLVRYWQVACKYLTQFTMLNQSIQFHASGHKYLHVYLILTSYARPQRTIRKPVSRG